MTISKATVLGAGTMGSQIAALLVNAGLKVKLLDIVIDEKDPNKISKKAYDVITDAKRPLLFDLEFASNLSYGNFQDDLTGEDDADIYIEAVKEELDIKHQVWKQVTQVAKIMRYLRRILQVFQSKQYLKRLVIKIKKDF